MRTGAGEFDGRALNTQGVLQLLVGWVNNRGDRGAGAQHSLVH